jgi:GDPmannose 4,6-dehydratase
MKKTALIVGITGQDAAYLSKLLLNKGYRVIGTSRDHQLSTFPHLTRLGISGEVELRSMSTHDLASVIKTVAETSPDEMYHLAGQSSVGLSFTQPLETLHSHIDGITNILEAVRFTGLNCRIYNAGSGECFGTVVHSPASESDPFAPTSPYAIAKIAAYWLTKNYRESYGLHACTGILFNHESPLRPERFVTKKIIAAACRISKGSREKLVLGDLSVKRDWGWAPEYVEAMWLMLQQPVAQDYVIATGEKHSLEEFVDVTFSYLNLNWKDHVVVDESLFRPNEIRENFGDASKAHRELGWRATLTMPKIIPLLIEDCLTR